MRLTGALLIGNPLLAAEFGIRFSVGLPAARELVLVGLVTGLAFVTGALPAWQAYRISLHDGLDPTG
jgi:putative ABC transport system permease protein